MCWRLKKLIEESGNSQFQMDIFKDIFQEYLERKNAFVWVMEKEGQVIGFLNFHEKFTMYF